MHKSSILSIVDQDIHYRFRNHGKTYSEMMNSEMGVDHTSRGKDIENINILIQFRGVEYKAQLSVKVRGRMTANQASY